jgi:hypothetical protein
MRRFEIVEIANGWLICYHTECGYVQRFFTNVDDIIQVMKVVIDTKNIEDTARNVRVK